MDAQKTGSLILEARTKLNMTQKELAEKINVSEKAVSKWENGRGCPDITLLPSLSSALQIDIESILRGDLSRNKTKGGSMNRLKIYRCIDCGNIITATNKIELSCCGHLLEELIPASESNSSIIKSIEESDNQFYVTFNNPMTKTDYIAGVVTSAYDRTTVIPMFAEQEPSVILPQLTGVKLFLITNKNLCYSFFFSN